MANPRKTSQLHVRNMDPEVMNKMRQLANLSQRDLSSYVRRLFFKHVQSEFEKPEKERGQI